MMRTLGKEIFETFKVSPKWFTSFFLELHDILPNESDLVHKIEFFQEGLDEIIPRSDGIDR